MMLHIFSNCTKKQTNGNSASHMHQLCILRWTWEGSPGIGKWIILAGTEDCICGKPVVSLLQLFEGIQAILFLVASSDFDQTLREERGVNRLREAVNLFEDIWYSRWEQV